MGGCRGASHWDRSKRGLRGGNARAAYTPAWMLLDIDRVEYWARYVVLTLMAFAQRLAPGERLI